MSALLLHIKVIEGKVAIADANGKADPYCIIYLAMPNVKSKNWKKVGQTKIIDKQRNIIWNETFSCEISDDELTKGTLHFHCWDKDRLTDDRLGEAQLLLHDIPAGFDSIAKWMHLQDKNVNKNSGQLSLGDIFVAVAIETSTHSFPDPKHSQKLLNDAIKRFRRGNIGWNWRIYASTWNMGDAKLPNNFDSWLSKEWMDKQLKIQGSDINSGLSYPQVNREFNIYHSALIEKIKEKELNGENKELNGMEIANVLKDNKLCINNDDIIKIGEKLLELDLIIPNIPNYGAKNIKFEINSSNTYKIFMDPHTTLTRNTLPNDNKYDVYVIAIQEAPKHVDVSKDIGKYLGIKNYNLLHTPALGQIRLYVYIRHELCEYVRFVEASTEATGIGGLISNKGGIGVSMEICDTRICFVGSHLAAHQDMVDRRNHDVAEIIHGVRIGMQHVDLLHQFHHVIWMGDLNYRLDYGEQGNNREPSEKDFNELVKHIEMKNFSPLLLTDQLYSSQNDGLVFLGFKESRIMYPPTFKVERNEELKYQIKRSPAWTDRILWLSMNGFESNLRQLGTTCVSEMKTSDHKPVRGDFLLHVEQSNPAIADDYQGGILTFTQVELGEFDMSIGNVADDDIMKQFSEFKSLDNMMSFNNNKRRHSNNTPSPINLTPSQSVDDIRNASPSQRRSPRAPNSIKSPKHLSIKNSMIFVKLASPIMFKSKAKFPPRSSTNGKRIWKVGDIDPIKLVMNDRQRLSESFITLRVYVQGRTTHPKVGCAVLPLSNLIGDKDYHKLLGEIEFSTEVFRNGLHVADISGKFVLSWHTAGQQSNKRSPIKMPSRVSSLERRQMNRTSDDSVIRSKEIIKREPSKKFLAVDDTATLFRPRSSSVVLEHLSVPNKIHKRSKSHAGMDDTLSSLDDDDLDESALFDGNTDGVNHAAVDLAPLSPEVGENGSTDNEDMTSSDTYKKEINMDNPDMNRSCMRQCSKDDSCIIN